MLKTVSDEEKVTATALPIIDGTYRIRSVAKERLLAPFLSGNFMAVGFFEDSAKEQAILPWFNCDWIIERYPNSNPDAGKPGFMGAPKEPWYRIWNKSTGQILVAGGDPNKPPLFPMLFGNREEFMGDKTLGTLIEMWRIIKFERERLRTGPHADETGTWFMIQNVYTGQLLVPAEPGFAGSVKDFDFACIYGDENACFSENDPRQMWTLDFTKPAELLDLELHAGVAPQQGQEVLTTETSEYRNDSDAEQEHTFTFNYEYSDSYNFSWENSLSIGVEVEVSGEFPGFSASAKTTVQNTLTVGQAQTNTFTYSKSYEFPVKVPPHSIVKASMIIYKGSYDVGFTAKLRIGSEVREEKGTLRAQLGAGVTHYTVKQVKLDAQTDIQHSGNGGKKSSKRSK